MTVVLAEQRPVLAVVWAGLAESVRVLLPMTDLLQVVVVVVGHSQRKLGVQEHTDRRSSLLRHQVVAKTAATPCLSDAGSELTSCRAAEFSHDQRKRKP